MTTNELPAAATSRLNAAIAAGAYEVVALRLALGVLRTLDDARYGAAATRNELLTALDDLMRDFASRLEGD